jgi:GNAT superfamily N-acetyltransferase
MSAGSGSWTRELVELAALFVAVAAADLFANSLAHVSGGAVVLTAMAAVLVLCAVVHHRVRHRSRTPLPRTAEPPGAPLPVSPPVSPPVSLPVVEDRPVAPAAMWRVRATVRDTPGGLARLAASLARRDVNILSVQVHPVPAGVVDEFLVEARLPAAEIAAAVGAGGGWDVTVTAADTHDLVDIPTRILTMVSQDVAGGIDLARSARTLLGECELRWEPGGEPDREPEDEPGGGPAGATMRLRDPEGGVLAITRPDAGFTPAEYARVRALLDLDEQFARWLRAQHSTLLLASGEQLTMRQAAVADVPALVAMHARCSGRSRRSRYLSGGARPTAAELARMVNRRHGRTLVVAHPDGDVVAMGNLMHDGAAAEVALLVEDSWQRRGIGTALLRGLLAAAPDGRPTSAVTAHDNRPMLSVLDRAGAELDHVDTGVVHLTLPAR